MLGIKYNEGLDNCSKINILYGILDIINNVKNAQKPAIASFWFSTLRNSIIGYYGNKEFYKTCFACQGWITTANKFEKKIKSDILRLENQ